MMLMCKFVYLMCMITCSHTEASISYSKKLDKIECNQYRAAHDQEKRQEEIKDLIKREES